MSIDKDLYSRQLNLFNISEMELLQRAKILIIGLNGIGLETAKCLILTGIKQITISETDNITYDNIIDNYFASEKDIGKNILDVVVPHLSELNKSCVIRKLRTKRIIPEIVLKHDIIIYCDDNILIHRDIIILNKLTHAFNKKLIVTNTLGVLGYIYCDFGRKIIVKDQTGIDAKYGIIEKYEGKNFTTDVPHKLSRGDIIQLCYKKNAFVTNITGVNSRNEFTIEDDIKFDKKYRIEFRQIKPEILISHEKILNIYSRSFTNDVINFNHDRNALLHKINMCLILFKTKYFRMPTINDSKEVIDTLRTMTDMSYDEEFVIKIISACTGILSPFRYLFGAITAQEVLKVITKKYMPISQFMYLDMVDLVSLTATNSSRVNRFSKLEKIIGRNMQNKLNNKNIFVVGAGAVGCEHVRNLASVGVCNIKITDMDTIEKSNLNRQFMFNQNDIGKFKSDSASNFIKKFYDINVICYTDKLCYETIKKNNYFKNVDFIMTALDNVEARLLVDEQCVNYEIPMIDSGTTGLKCSIQTVIPRKTLSYGSMKDPVEESVPLCTIKNFPYKIEHTIQWATEIFNEYFGELTGIDKKKFMKNLWNDLFIEPIEKMIKEHPYDEEVDGKKFWSESRRYPNRQDKSDNLDYLKFMKFGLDVLNDKSNKLIFNRDNDSHINFITVCSNIRAKTFGIDPCDEIKTKIIAGKIIPAIMTTTSIVSSLAILEMMKNLGDDSKSKNYFIDLASNMYIISETDIPKTIKIDNYKYNVWDKLIIPDYLTINDITEFINEKIFYDMDEDVEVEIMSIYYCGKKIFDESESKEQVIKNLIGTEGIIEIYTDHDEQVEPLKFIVNSNYE